MLAKALQDFLTLIEPTLGLDTGLRETGLKAFLKS